MLISHSRPRSITWAIRSNVGPTVFATAAAALTDGRPGSVTRFLWSATTMGYMQIEATWSAPAFIGLFGLIGTTLPAGMDVQLHFRIAGTASFTASPLLVYVVEQPHGERVAWARVAAGIEGFDGLRVTLRNRMDVGFPVVLAGDAVDIGELWIGETTEMDVRSDYSVVYEDPTVTTDTELAQPYHQRGTVRRVITFTPDVQERGPIGDNPDGVLPVERLIARTNRGRQCVVATHYQGEDEYLLPRTATFGTLTKGGYRHADGPLFAAETMTLREAPIPISLP